MKAEIKFANTSNGPKAFVKTFDDDWTPMSTPLKAYKKDMRSIKPAGKYEEGKDYMVAVSPWVLEAFLKANQIDYVQLIRGQDLKNPPVGSIRYANEKEVVVLHRLTAAQKSTLSVEEETREANMKFGEIIHRFSVEGSV